MVEASSDDAFASHARFFRWFLSPDDGRLSGKRSRKVLRDAPRCSVPRHAFPSFLSPLQRSRPPSLESFSHCFCGRCLIRWRERDSVWTGLKTFSVRAPASCLPSFSRLFFLLSRPSLRTKLSTGPGIWHWPSSSSRVSFPLPRLLFLLVTRVASRNYVKYLSVSVFLFFACLVLSRDRRICFNIEWFLYFISDKFTKQHNRVM